ncbi:MAG: hypothetical protein AAF449_19355 [Myxococcota bacterium]
MNQPKNLDSTGSYARRARADAMSALVIASAVGLLTWTACGDDEETPTTEQFELVGEWSSLFGDETITSTSWASGILVEFDEAQNFAVTQNQPTADFFPSKFNKIVYTEPVDDSFFYCFVDFGLDTAAEARTSTQTADATDPASGGCGNFTWTQLTRK